jgi:hypothetical protein
MRRHVFDHSFQRVFRNLGLRLIVRVYEVTLTFDAANVVPRVKHSTHEIVFVRLTFGVLL